MTRMIERWFPCKEVSENSNSGWGSGNQERNLFTWFAARPTAQAKAAVICSLLNWPDDEAEQARLQELVRKAMTGRYEAWDELREQIIADNPEGVSVLDPFSGRGMIPLEAARLGFTSYGIDYSPVAVLASTLLTDYPFRNWDNEPPLPFGDQESDELFDSGDTPRLLRDVETVLKEVGNRYTEAMQDYYPRVDGKQPWGYLWAVTLPCQECGNRFPLVGSYELRKASSKKATKTKPALNDPGQSFYIEPDSANGTFRAVVHEGPPRLPPTLTNAIGPDGRKVLGKSAVCPFCGHVHAKAVHQRLTAGGLGQDALLLAAEDEAGIKRFRQLESEEVQAVAEAERALGLEGDFAPRLPAVPSEGIAIGNSDTIRPSAYGAETFGQLMCPRQTLAFVRLARVINDLSYEMTSAHLSKEYIRALTAYASAQLIRKIRYSTRGATIQLMRDGGVKVNHIFANESTIGYSYDFFEVGVGSGPGSWISIAAGGLSTLRGLLSDATGTPTTVSRGSATALPIPTGSMSAVVTDPPYDEMIAYADASDLFYCWLKRSLYPSWPELTVTADSHGAQEKTEEAIVKRFRAKKSTDLRDHRTAEHYDSQMSFAFGEMARVVRSHGVVTIVFGHGEPEVWQRLLGAIHRAGLVLTGSWPANTEAGGQQGAANIRTTLTMACRPAANDRPQGRKGSVEAAIKSEVKARYPDWERWGLAPTDMLMAAAGPAMEIVGQYSEILDAKGEAVDIATFLPVARAAVQEAMAVEIDHHPLETFDARTRFALWWVRLFGRDVAPKSELRWQALAAQLDVSEVRDLVPDADKGCRFVDARKFSAALSPESSAIDVALALAAVADQGREAMAEVLAASARDPQDAYLWAAVKFLADRLPDSDADSIAFNRVHRAREGISAAVRTLEVAAEASEQERAEQEKQARLF